MAKSVTPKRFRYWARSERPWPSCRPRLVLVPGAAHEVRLRNDTQEAVRISEIRMPADFLVSEWVAGSAQIGPGSHSILKVQWDATQAPEGWSGGIIRLRLAQPVGGQTELTIPILQRFP